MTGSPTFPLRHQKETDMTLIDQPATDASAAPSAPAYRLTGVTKTYQQKGRVVQALKGIDVEIATGDFVTIQARPAAASRPCCSCSEPSTCPRPGTC